MQTLSKLDAQAGALWRERTVLDDALPLLIGLAMLVAWDRAGLDIELMRGWGTASGFPWRHHWFTAGLMHGGVRVLGWLMFAALLVSVWRPFSFLEALTRRERVWWLGTTLLCVTLVSVLKRASETSCPWALAEFGGGVVDHVPHWVAGRFDGGPGGCFPSGHASTAFAFIPGWFVLRERLPGPARLWLLATIIAGVTLAAVQLVRGAHYASHSMWTAWICWAVSAASLHAFTSFSARDQSRAAQTRTSKWCWSRSWRI